MGLAGFGEAADQGESAQALLEFPWRQRGAALFADSHPVALGGMRGEGGVDFAFGFVGAAGDDGKIFFLHLVILELVREMTLGGDIFCQEQDAAGVFVEAVDQAQSRIGGAGAREIDLRGKLLQQARGFAAPGDGGQARRFFDGDQLIVLEENGDLGGFCHLFLVLCPWFLVL